MTKEGEDEWKPPCLDRNDLRFFIDLVPNARCLPLPFEVPNLRSFLARMVGEGRPTVAEEAIMELEGILKKLEEIRGA